MPPSAGAPSPGGQPAPNPWAPRGPGQDRAPSPPVPPPPTPPWPAPAAPGPSHRPRRTRSRRRSHRGPLPGRAGYHPVGPPAFGGPPYLGGADPVLPPYIKPREPDGRLGAALIGALVGAVVAALVAAAVVAVNDEPRRGRSLGHLERGRGPRHPAAARRGRAVGRRDRELGDRRIRVRPQRRRAHRDERPRDRRLDRSRASCSSTARRRRPSWSGPSPTRTWRSSACRTVTTSCRRSWGRPTRCEVGDHVVAIGNALGLGVEPSVTLGIVSAKDRSIETEAGLPRAPDPDRRRHQPGQLGRSAGQLAGRGRGDQHGQRPRRPEHRVRAGHRRGEAADRGAPGRPGRDQRRHRLPRHRVPGGRRPGRAPVPARHLRGRPGFRRLRPRGHSRVGGRDRRPPAGRRDHRGRRRGDPDQRRRGQGDPHARGRRPHLAHLRAAR